MPPLTLDLTHIQPFVPDADFTALKVRLRAAHQKILHRTGAGHEFLGWLDLPAKMSAPAALAPITAAAAQIHTHSPVLVVIGIGGSYLGARAALEFLAPDSSCKILFAGHDLSSFGLQKVLDQLGERDFSVNIISKSGTTLEPALAFRFFRERLHAKYGQQAKDHIFATTDAASGVLKALANEQGWPTFTIPDDVGGRYSVLTAVGLLPLAAANCDLTTLLAGAQAASRDLQTADPSNQAWQYAGYRYLLARQGKSLEVLATYEPQLQLLGQWWQQLFGESEGKNGQGLYPATVNFTADLHSLGQYLQQGQRHLLETTLWLDQPSLDLPIPSTCAGAAFADTLDYLSGSPLASVNQKAFLGTLAAHTSGGVPNFVFHLAAADAFTLGYFFFFQQFACALSAYLLDVNPFDQPGVEAYKKNMFALLKSP